MNAFTLKPNIQSWVKDSKTTHIKTTAGRVRASKNKDMDHLIVPKKKKNHLSKVASF